MSFPPHVKESVMRRDGHECRYCGDRNRDNLQLDHVIPQSFTQGPNNAQVLCKSCNEEKGDRFPRAAEVRENQERQAAWISDEMETVAAAFQEMVMSHPLVSVAIKVWRSIAYERRVSDEPPRRFAEVVFRLATESGLTEDVLIGAVDQTLRAPRDSQLAYFRKVATSEMEKVRRAS